MTAKGQVMIDPELRGWATVRQLEIIEALDKHGNMAAAGRALKIDESTVRDSIKRLKSKAAKAGYSPEHHMTRTVPDGFIVKGVSTYFDEDGNARGQWVKSSIDPARAEAMAREAVAAMCQEIPRLSPAQGPTSTQAELCNLYTLTDSHVGAMCWGREAGEDWDLKIAEATLSGCFEYMVAAAPPARVGFVNQLGDFMHYDSMSPVTPSHGHLLDADGRFSKMVGVAVRILRRAVDFALTKHETVIVLLAEGNHDMASSIWLRHMFKALYENEPRVHVIDSELPYYAYQHGLTMLAFHHGHLKKNDQLPLLFAAQFPKVWGATEKRYAHTGHRHHMEQKEHSGMSVHQHPTLAARDAYAARGGWIAERRVTALTYHSTFGEVARNTVTPEMLQAA